MGKFTNITWNLVIMKKHTFLIVHLVIYLFYANSAIAENDFLKLESSILKKEFDQGVKLVKKNPNLLGQEISNEPDEIVRLILQDERALETVQYIIENNNLRE